MTLMERHINDILDIFSGEVKRLKKDRKFFFEWAKQLANGSDEELKNLQYRFYEQKKEDHSFVEKLGKLGDKHFEELRVNKAT